jgi:hypothetical protein
MRGAIIPKIVNGNQQSAKKSDHGWQVCGLSKFFSFFVFAFWEWGHLIVFAGTEDRAPLGSDLSAVSGQDRRSGRLSGRPGMPLRA